MGLMAISKDLADFIQQFHEDTAAVEDEHEQELQDLDEFLAEYEVTDETANTFKHDFVRCPHCYRTYNIIHFECSEYLDVCTCDKDHKDTIYYCSPCDTMWDTETGEIISNFSQEDKTTTYDDGYVPAEAYGYGKKEDSTMWDDEDGYYDSEPYPYTGTSLVNQPKLPINTTGGKVANSTKKTQAYTPKCSHKHEKILLQDGTPIYCSSVRTSAADGSPVPDFGLYADYIWSPTWRNEFIHWPDYDIPSNEELGFQQIYDAYYRATQGEMVEIGCVGGHGRTGTILAIMQIAAAKGEVTAKEAYSFVKTKYCSSAIESEIQEWYIASAAGHWYGHEVPEKPAKPIYTTAGATCSIPSHYAMMLRGHQRCATKGTTCQYWSSDRTNYNKKKKQQYDMDNFWKALAIVDDYDYVYGGVIRLEDDPKNSPCSPLDHYVMICLGHESCLRYPEECTWWSRDYQEWLTTGTINEEKDWTSMSASAAELYKIYPAVEVLNKKDATANIVASFIQAQKEKEAEEEAVEAEIVEEEFPVVEEAEMDEEKEETK